MVYMARTVLTYSVSSLIVGALIFSTRRILNPTYTKTITWDVIQGILVGVGLAFIPPDNDREAYVTKVNGWMTLSGCGEPGNSILRRAACAVIFLGPINVPQEAMYWTRRKDGAGHTLNGRGNYILHFPAGRSLRIMRSGR